MTTRSSGLRWLGAGVAAISLAIALRCSRTTPPPPPPTAATANQTPGAVIPAPTTRVAIPATAALTSWADRAISGWQASLQGQGVAWSFRSTAGSGVHCGGVSLPTAGAKSFRLTVTFTKSASAVKALFVVAQAATGKEVDR